MDLKFLDSLARMMQELRKACAGIRESGDEFAFEYCTMRDLFVELQVEQLGEKRRSDVERSYLRLWVYLIQNYKDLSGERPRSGHKKTERGDGFRRCQYRWAGFLALAKDQGYSLVCELPILKDLVVADWVDVLDRAYGEGSYDMNSVKTVISNLLTATVPNTGLILPLISNPSLVQSTSIKSFLRMGPPSISACDVAKETFHEQNLSSDSLLEEEGYDISEFCILRSFFLNFFCPWAPFSKLFAVEGHNPDDGPLGGLPSNHQADMEQQNQQDQQDKQDQQDQQQQNQQQRSQHPTDDVRLQLGRLLPTDRRDMNLEKGCLPIVLSVFRYQDRWIHLGWRVMFLVKPDKRRLFLEGLQKTVSDVTKNVNCIQYFDVLHKCITVEELYTTQIEAQPIFPVIRLPDGQLDGAHYHCEVKKHPQANSNNSMIGQLEKTIVEGSKEEFQVVGTTRVPICSALNK